MTMTYLVHDAGKRRRQVAFERVADLAVDRVVTRLMQHVVVLRATRGVMSVEDGRLPREDFLRFLDTLEMSRDLSGIQGIGFARLLRTEDALQALDEVRDQYGVQVVLHPATDQPYRTPVVLLEPSSPRNIAALGFDMYADPTRRAAMDLAVATGTAQMSAPVELVQEITADKQTGFLVYLPFHSAAPAAIRGPAGALSPTGVSGFVYAPFRGANLIRAALASTPRFPVAMRVVDTADPTRPLYDGLAGVKATAPLLERKVDLLGRQWTFQLRGTDVAGGPLQRLDSLLLGAISMLFAVTAGYATATRQQEAIQARAAARSARREAESRGLMLQEMTHRIKNHIARIQSIARQSARGASDVKTFTAAFDARLQAMAAVQDILAGTHSARADLRAILLQELRQGLEADEAARCLDGPAVLLNERQSHALALVIHELVTNAMKYGGLSVNGAGLSVRWVVQEQAGGGPPLIHLDWLESLNGPALPPPAATGFGSRLIEASLTGELGGSLKRDLGPDGLRVRLTFPICPETDQPPPEPPLPVQPESATEGPRPQGR